MLNNFFLTFILNLSAYYLIVNEKTKKYYVK